jgi:hypothetical protein
MPLRPVTRRPTRRLLRGQYSFARGIVGNRSETGENQDRDYATNADNASFYKKRAAGVRRGFFDTMAGTLPFPPHSILIYYSTTGVVVFAGCANQLYRVAEGQLPVQQTLPYTASAAKWSSTNINGVLVACQEDGTNPPIFYDGNTWQTTVFPQPVAPGVVAANDSGSFIDVGDHYWRVRWIFKNGSSLASPASAKVTIAGGTPQHVTVTPPTVPTRSDYIGYAIERTKISSPTLWFSLVSFTNAATFVDTLADSALGAAIGVEPGVHNQSPQIDSKYFAGLITHRQRLIGWAGGTLFISQQVADVAEGSGPFNFPALQTMPASDDVSPNRVTAVTHQGEHLIVGMTGSIAVLDGTDPTNFSCTLVDDRIGCPSSRGLVGVGRTAFVYSGAGTVWELTRTIYGNIRPIRVGIEEVGHYLDDIDPVHDADVVLEHDGRDLIYLAYRRNSSAVQEDMLTLRLSTRAWEHYVGVRANDLKRLKVLSSFNGAPLLFADGLLSSVSGALSPGLSTPTYYTFMDKTGGGTSQVYVMAIDQTGSALWPGPVIVSSRPSGGGATYFETPRVCADQQGNVFVAYASLEGNTAKLYVNRVAPDRSTWSVTGTLVMSLTTTASAQIYHRVVPDGSGGCYVVGLNGPSGSANVQMAHLTSGGAFDATWGGAPVTLDTGGHVPSDTTDILVTPDGAYAYVGWIEQDTGGVYRRFQRVRLLDGAAQWAAGGVKPFSTGGNGNGAASFADGPPAAVSSDGSLIVMIDNSTGTGLSWLARQMKVTDGSTVWTSGNLLASVPATTIFADGCSDGAGGMWGAFFTNNATSGLQEIYVQRVSSAGALGFPTPIKIFSGPAGGLAFPPLKVIPDGAGGVVVMAVTGNGTGPAPYLLHVQRVGQNGVTSWGTPTGMLLISPPAGYAAVPIMSLCTDGTAGAWFTWYDVTTAAVTYMNHVGFDGTLLYPSATPHSITPAGRDHIGPTFIAYTNARPGEIPISLSSGYHVWAGLTGFRDMRGHDDSGGIPIDWMIETPTIDDGAPNDTKDYEHLALFYDQADVTLAATITTDTGVSATVAISGDVVGNAWGSSTDPPDVNTLIWGVGVWGGSSSNKTESGLPPGVIGTNYKVRVTAQLEKDFSFRGIDTRFNLTGPWRY